MASPALESLKQQVEDLSSEYGARFAGHSRVTREIAEIEALLARAHDVVSKLEALPKTAKDSEFDAVLVSAKGNVDLFTGEREAIRAAKGAGPTMVEFAQLGAQANFVFARYRRHFAGKARPTRDLGLLAEIAAELTTIQTRMRS